MPNKTDKQGDPLDGGKAIQPHVTGPLEDCDIGPPEGTGGGCCGGSGSSCCDACNCNPCRCQHTVKGGGYSPRIVFSGVREVDEYEDCSEGNGDPAYETADVAVSWPAVNDSIILPVECSGDYSVGQCVFVWAANNLQAFGWLRITSIPSTTQIQARNTGEFARAGTINPADTVPAPIKFQVGSCPAKDLDAQTIREALLPDIEAEINKQLSAIPDDGPCFDPVSVAAATYGRLATWGEPADGKRCLKLQNISEVDDAHLPGLTSSACQGDLGDEYRFDYLDPKQSQSGSLVSLYKRAPADPDELPRVRVVEPINQAEPHDTFTLLGMDKEGGQTNWIKADSLWMPEQNVPEADIDANPGDYQVGVWRKIGRSYKLERLKYEEGKTLTTCGGKVQWVDAPTRFELAGPKGPARISPTEDITEDVGGGISLFFSKSYTLPGIKPSARAARIRILMELSTNVPVPDGGKFNEPKFAPGVTALVDDSPIAIAQGSWKGSDFITSAGSGYVTILVDPKASTQIDFKINYHNNDGKADDQARPRARVRFELWVDGYECAICDA